jgi:hypothetical protein
MFIAQFLFENLLEWEYYFSGCTIRTREGESWLTRVTKNEVDQILLSEKDLADTD